MLQDSPLRSHLTETSKLTEVKTWGVRTVRSSESDQIIRIGLGVVEDDVHDGVGHVIDHRVVENVTLLEWRDAHSTFAQSVLSGQHSNVQNATIAFRVRGRVSGVCRVVGVHGEVHSVAEGHSCKVNQAFSNLLQRTNQFRASIKSTRMYTFYSLERLEGTSTSIPC